MSNTNGNATLFLTSMFSFLLPSYKIFAGRYMATTVFFYYLFGSYALLFFTRHLGFDKEIYKNFRHGKNDNETHYAALVTGAVLGLALRKRIIL